MERYPEIFARIADSPLFEVANHTYDHRAWTASCYGLPYIATEEQKRAQVKKTNRLIKADTGERPDFIRLPGLCHGSKDIELIDELGMSNVDWDLGASDAFVTNPQALVSDILGQVQPGSIIVLHSNGAPNAPATATALPALIEGLRDLGLEPVGLSELLE